MKSYTQDQQTRLDATPNAPDAMWQAWADIVHDRAPDLAAMLGITERGL